MIIDCKQLDHNRTVTIKTSKTTIPLKYVVADQNPVISILLSVSYETCYQ